MALFTDLLAPLLYRRRDDRLEELFLVAMRPSIHMATTTI
jgi:hypothetical protein